MRPGGFPHVFVEALVEEVSEEPAALGAAESHGPANRIAAVLDQEVFVRGVVAKEGDDVSRRREPETLDVGIPRLVDQLIDVVRGEVRGHADVLVAGRAVAPVRAVGEGPLVARDDLKPSVRPLLPVQHRAGHALLDGGIEVVQDAPAARQRIRGGSPTPPLPIRNSFRIHLRMGLPAAFFGTGNRPRVAPSRTATSACQPLQTRVNPRRIKSPSASGSVSKGSLPRLVTP